MSLPTESEANDMMTCTQTFLTQFNMKLHKTAFNTAAVQKAYPPDDLAKGIKKSQFMQTL